MSDNSDFGAFLVGFVVGGLTGAAVSLLFAPQSGEETRAILRDKAVELRDRLVVQILTVYAEYHLMHVCMACEDLTGLE